MAFPARAFKNSRMSEPDSSGMPPPPPPGLVRLINLSDGVFAIAMTLLAFDLNGPAKHADSLGALLGEMAPQLQAFFWSFASIAIFWAMHRQTFARLKATDGIASALSLALLAFVSLIPAATHILYQAYTPAAVYLIIAAVGAAGLANGVLWFYAAFVAKLLLMPLPLRLRLYNLVVLACVPPAMTALGVLSYFPSLHWAPLMTLPLAALLIFSSRYIRRKAAA